MLFTNNLVEIWSDFVCCRKRLKTMLPFLLGLARECSAPRIIDLATGIGCEVTELAKLGHDITANEIDEGFRRKAMLRSKPWSDTIRWTACDWRNLQTGFAANVFDLCLLLGNSFPLLFQDADRRRAAAQISAICAPGGRVVIDVRNFNYILDNAEEILAGNFRYSRRVVYCGTQIEGRPIKISPKVIRFGYFAKGEHLIGTLDMFPLSEPELEETFRLAGLTKIGVFSDLVEGKDDTADFYTFIFKKL